MKKEQILPQMTDLIENNNVIDLNLVRKGLATGGPTGGDENWLKALPAGTVFNCKRKSAPKDILFLDLYCVLEQKTMSTNLMQKVPDGRQIDLWFPTLEFSRANTLIEVIATVEFGYEKEKAAEEEQLENKGVDTNGESNRPV